MTLTTELGTRAEDYAHEYLESKGLKSVERNFRCRMGEIDLIMCDGKTLVFVEVRYRKNRDFGGPIVSVSQSKQNKLRATAKLYLQQSSHNTKAPVRFDVVGITGCDDSVEWVRNAIEDCV